MVGSGNGVVYLHRGVQLKLAYSWARPAILVAGKGRGGMFLFLLFLHFHSCSYFFPNRLFHLLYYLFYLFSPFLWDTSTSTQAKSIFFCHFLLVSTAAHDPHKRVIQWCQPVCPYSPSVCRSVYIFWLKFCIKGLTYFASSGF